MNPQKILLITLIVVGTHFQLHAQELDSLLNLNAFTAESELQKILNKGTTTGSLTELTFRETPGIMSIVTREEIKLSGARDIIDVLRLVPGFDINHDVQYILGVSLRGAWANEGKVLILLDGQPLNDLLYQTVPLDGRIPVDAIQRIEIIRGPGSAIYGGSAEYGVINIITEAAESLNGIRAFSNVGFHGNLMGRNNYGFSIGGKQKISWDASIYTGRSIISDQIHTELDGGEQDFAKHSKIRPLNVNAGISRGGLKARVMLDHYQSEDLYDFASFKQFYGDLAYRVQVTSKLFLIPQLKFTNQIPWAYGDNEAQEYDLKAGVQRYHGGIRSILNVSRKVNIDGGLEFYTDRVNYMEVPEDDYVNISSLNNSAVYIQGLFKHRLFNATAGFRYEKNNLTEGSLVPRFAVTKKIENFNFKALYSHSFRTPAIENFNLSRDELLKPEKSRTYEFEAGYQFTPNMLFTINGFHNSTKDIIVYYNEDEEHFYRNRDRFGTKGIEATYGYRIAKGFINMGYSFSEAIKNPTTESYQVPENQKQYLGQLRHKMTLNGLYKINSNLSVNSSMIYGGKRYALTGLDGEESPVFAQLNSYLLVNAYIHYTNLVNGLDVGLGTYDILNQRPAFAQGFIGESAILPNRSREIIFKLSYSLDFK